MTLSGRLSASQLNNLAYLSLSLSDLPTTLSQLSHLSFLLLHTRTVTPPNTDHYTKHWRIVFNTCCYTLSRLDMAVTGPSVRASIDIVVTTVTVTYNTVIPLQDRLVTRALLQLFSFSVALRQYTQLQLLYTCNISFLILSNS